MFKSSRRDRTEGTLDRIAGRLLEAIGRLTGRSSYEIKGKAARAWQDPQRQGPPQASRALSTDAR